MTTTRPRMANLFVHGERLLVEKNDFLVIFQRGLVDLLVLLDATAHKDLPARAQHLLIVSIIVIVIIIESNNSPPVASAGSSTAVVSRSSNKQANKQEVGGVPRRACN